MRDGRNMNLNVSEEKMFSLIHLGKSDTTTLSEVVDDSVKVLLDDL